MKTNLYITITSCVSAFDSKDCSFAMTPTQYIVLNHTTSPFPVHAHFIDTNLKKRWGADGPKVAVGMTVTLGGLLEQVIRQHTFERALDFAEVKVTNIAYLSARSNLTPSPMCMFLLSN